ncbi:wall-associated receptor kinase 2-like [Humulus lupulus]|uniref:wall-associated receptor kinase 2-like n=1 Tax=Humulus lupulus TaxID=3486 RepID=UPI002B4090F0|nr:wall-associated receptor kinase 2-like [Humulus lupulus]
MALNKVSMLIMQVMIGTIFIDVVFCSSRSIATPIRGCNSQSCGDLAIPFPFGLDKGCYREPPVLFQIHCLKSTPYLFNSSFEVKDISVLKGEVTIILPIAQDCYSENGTQLTNGTRDVTRSLNEFFSVSYNKNKFYSIGCDNSATITGSRRDKNYTTGCISSCSYADEIDLKSCSGVGCCRTSIPRELVNYGLKLGSNNNHRSVWSFNQCSYAFVMQETAFKFSSFQEFNNDSMFPVVLDWAVGFNSCQVAIENMTTDYACKENSVCVNSTSRPGYLCRCSEGYQGNPYLPNGCIGT